MNSILMPIQWRHPLYRSVAVGASPKKGKKVKFISITPPKSRFQKAAENIKKLNGR